MWVQTETKSKNLSSKSTISIFSPIFSKLFNQLNYSLPLFTPIAKLSGFDFSLAYLALLLGLVEIPDGFGEWSGFG